MPRKLLLGEKHHWWPKSLSKFWTDSNGLIGRVDSGGKVSRSRPKNSARIADGHNIRFGSQWDQTFEQMFDSPDSKFPSLVEELETLVEFHRNAQCSSLDFLPHVDNDPIISKTIECMLSLVVRSPSFRQDVALLINSVRTTCRSEECEPFIAANLYSAYSLLKPQTSAEGKFLIIWSPEKEFLYGDGIYNNLSISSQSLNNARILVPMTPNIAVLYALPIESTVLPKLFSIESNDNLHSLINLTTQIYSKNCLFFRRDRPELSEHFLRGEHLRYDIEDPVEHLVRQIPRVKYHSRQLNQQIGG